MCANAIRDAEGVSELHFDKEIDEMYDILRKEFDFIEIEEKKASQKIENNFRVRQQKIKKPK
jgi:hypothetical protein